MRKTQTKRYLFVSEYEENTIRKLLPCQHNIHKIFSGYFDSFVIAGIYYKDTKTL